jgi:hypothetical protein
MGPEGPAGDPGPEGPAGDPGPAGSGFVTYSAATSAAQIDAHLTNGTVYLELPAGNATWAAYTGIANFGAYTGGHARVDVNVAVAGASGNIVNQIMVLAESASYRLTAWRRKVGAGAWGAWAEGIRVKGPTGNQDAVNKSYADNLLTFAGVGSWQNTAALDAEQGDSRAGAIADGIGDMGAYTGLSAYDGVFVGIPLVEHHSSSKFGVASQQYLQRIRFVDPNIPGYVVLWRERHRVAPAALTAWTAWTVE